MGFILAGCAAGVAEYQLYIEAFDEQFQRGQMVLDAVARSERVVGKHRITRRKVVQFDPNEAAYYLKNVDPPIAASIRASLKALKSYNDALGGLANGEAAAALSNRVGTLTTNIVAAIAASQVAVAGTSAQAGAAALTSRTADLLGDILPGFQQVAGFAAHEAFRQQLLAAYPTMRKLVETLRDGTPIMYELFKLGAPPSELDADRQLLAGWVLLLDQTLVTMQAAAVAAMTGASSVDLATLSEASVDLRILAEKVKAAR